jgi:hypothetical protein
MKKNNIFPHCETVKGELLIYYKIEAEDHIQFCDSLVANHSDFCCFLLFRRE